MSSFSLFRPGGEPAADRPWSVSELSGQIRAALETEFAGISVVGEVSNLARPRSGHLYFSLKDSRATIRAVMWKGQASRLVFDLEDGLEVRVRGDVTVYEPRGDYQIQVRAIEPEGLGSLELAFRQMFERLQAEGLFDPSRKRPLPRYPRRIAVVTSPTGAAVRDFLQVVGRRWRAAEVLIVPAKMQGLGAAGEIAEGIALANRIAGIDLIVLARGGGSLEDLWAFNEEVVARAIVASAAPVVSAVGHEVDVTIADHAADFRALTPSEAGERCVPDAAELRSAVDRLGQRLAAGLLGRVQRRQLQVDRLSDRLIHAMDDRITEVRTRLATLGERAICAARGAVETRRHRLGEAAAKLEALSPLGVLSRGYSLTFKEDGRSVVRDAADVRAGDLIVTRLASGRFVSRVVATPPDDTAIP
jgi:exodeoxyribonuclease VII large subunit